MLRIESLTIRFGGFVAVDAVSLDVPADGLTGLIGPNGAGKSTLFSAITGFIRPAKGRVVFGGRDVTGATPEARVRAGLGRTFQVPQEFKGLTVRENLAVAVPDHPGEHLSALLFAPARVRRAEAAATRRVDDVLEQIALGPLADARASTLSGGQRKLLELGRLLLAGPRLVLLDEPFAGINPVMIERIAALIQRLHADGTGFLIVEHNIEALARLVRTLHVMDRGRMIAEGTPAQVLAEPKVKTAYLGGAA